MYDGMRATTKWAALYFILLMTIGNYILFNLLVAILVEGFANQPVKGNCLKLCPARNEGHFIRKLRSFQEFTLKSSRPLFLQVPLTCNSYCYQGHWYCFLLLIHCFRQCLEGYRVSCVQVRVVYQKIALDS